jgi:CheY-like chemotaxis protein
MDGYEVARRLQERATKKKPLLIAITGCGREQDRRRSAEAGIDLHLVKPVDPEAAQRLLRRFQSIIAKSEPAAADTIFAVPMTPGSLRGSE